MIDIYIEYNEDKTYTYSYINTLTGNTIIRTVDTQQSQSQLEQWYNSFTDNTLKFKRR